MLNLFKVIIVYLTMEKLISLLAIFSKTYPQLKDIEIEIIPYNNLFVARCVVDKIGEYIAVKKGRIHNIIPKKNYPHNKRYGKTRTRIIIHIYS